MGRGKVTNTMTTEEAPYGKQWALCCGKRLGLGLGLAKLHVEFSVT